MATKPKPKPKAKSQTVSTVDKQKLALQYGFALQVFQANTELWNLLNDAIDHTYSQAEFNARLYNTQWWKSHSDQNRQMDFLSKSDPAQYGRLQTQMFSKVHDLASAMGIKYDADLISKITKQALYEGWSDGQIRNALGGALDFASGGHFGGEAGQDEQLLRDYAYGMGVQFSDATLKTWLQQIVRGDKTVEDYKAYLQTMAQQAYPGYADMIKQGVSVRQIADPYIQTMGQILELNPGSIDLFNPTIRQALTGRPDKDGKVQQVPLWQFETELRKDPRWMQTNNARDSLDGVAHGVLQNFGLAW